MVDDKERDELKELARELAREISSAAGQDGLHVAERLGVFDAARPATGGPPRSDGTPPKRIGRWTLEERNGQPYYVGEPGGELGLWSSNAEIAPKGAEKRVVFLGESVARGFYYDPAFPPASTLEAMLSELSIPDGAQVVDLARLHLMGGELAELLQSSAALKPDAFVIFAGNNWLWNLPPQLTSNRNFSRVRAHVVQKGGIPALHRNLEGQVRAYVATLVQNIKTFCAAKRVPLVFVVPDGNLTDWQRVSDLDCPFLPGDGQERWLACSRAAQEAFDAGRIPEAVKQASEMVALDQGIAARGHFILGRCALREGRREEARRCFQRARDAHLATLGAPPTAYALVQEAIRAAHDGTSCIVVDLPAVFDQYLAGEVPGRQLFLDYCHLNSDGIIVAMAEIARVLGPLLGAPAKVDPASLRKSAARPSAEVEAEAYLGAAIHNAHWGQPDEVVRPLLCVAMGRSRAVMQPLMRELLTLIGKRVPMALSSAAERCDAMAKSNYLKATVATHSFGFKLFDQSLSDALVACLEESGVDCRDWFTGLRVDEKLLTERGAMNLLHETYARSWADWGRGGFDPWRTVVVRAYAAVSQFSLVCSGPDPITLEVTGRVGPNSGDGAKCEIWVNGKRCGDFSARTTWQTTRVELARSVCRRGTNTVEIRWPSRATATNVDTMRNAAWALERGLTTATSFFPVYGELHALRACVAPPRT